MQPRTLPALGLPLLLTMSTALGGPSPTATLLYESREEVGFIGQINTPFNPGFGGGPGFLDQAITNTGEAVVHVGLFNADITADEGVVKSSTGLNPFLGWIEGFLDAPYQDHGVRDIFSMDANNNGDSVFALRTGDGEFTIVTPISGVFLNQGPALFVEGDATTFDPGSSWDPYFLLGSGLKINDSRQVLVGHSVSDGTGSRRVLVRLDVDGSGNVTNQTVIAEEGGSLNGACLCEFTGNETVDIGDLLAFLALWFAFDSAADIDATPGVGITDLLEFLACWFDATSNGSCGGTDTWSVIHTFSDWIAMNNDGDVLFTGRTDGGDEGVYMYTDSSEGFVVRTGDPSVVGGTNWGSLSAIPLDLNNNGAFVVRAPLETPAGWTESNPDAGEDASQGGDGDNTIGTGDLTSIAGTLLDEHDVDVFRIRVTDTAAFSASLVGSPDTFDSQLHLVRTFFNSSGAFRVGVARNDDTSAVEAHATLDASVDLLQTDYYLCVSTRKANLLSSAGTDLWVRDPASIALDTATNTLYWPDPSEGVIRTATTAGVASADLPVSGVPTVPRDSGMLLGTPIAVDGAGGKLYFIERSEFRMKRSDLDGSNIEDVFIDAADPIQASTTQIAIDATTAPAKLWWATPAIGATTVTVWRADLDGSNFEPVVPSVVVGNAIGLAPDGANDRVFFSIGNGDIKVAALPIINGTEITDFSVGAGARDLAIDTAAGELYWTRASDGSVMKADLDGGNAGVAVVVVPAGQAPEATGIAVGGGKVYWTDVFDRSVNRANTDGSMIEEVFDMGPDVGVRTSDGIDLGAGGVGAFTKSDVAGSGPLSYTVALSGASFFFEPNVVAVDNTTLVAQTGTTLAPISPSIIESIGATVRISDAGDVLWIADFGDETVFQNQSLVFDETATLGFTITGIEDGARTLDLSDDGRYALIRLFDGTAGDIGGGGGGGNGLVELDFGP